MGYDNSNIFARILRGEIPCNKVYEDEHVLAFRDIRPQAKVHALVIPKGAYVSAQDFGEQASDQEIAAGSPPRRSRCTGLPPRPPPTRTRR